MSFQLRQDNHLTRGCNATLAKRGISWRLSLKHGTVPITKEIQLFVQILTRELITFQAAEISGAECSKVKTRIEGIVPEVTLKPISLRLITLELYARCTRPKNILRSTFDMLQGHFPVRFSRVNCMSLYSSRYSRLVQLVRLKLELGFCKARLPRLRANPYAGILSAQIAQSRLHVLALPLCC